MSALSLSPRRAVADGTAWTPVRASHPSPALDHLRLVTLNTWFAPDDRPLRLPAQLQALEALDADVIALQEVTGDLLGALLAAPWLRDRYAVPDQVTLPLLSHGYGVFLAVRPPVRTFTWEPLDSAMGRSLLAAELADGTRIGTVHLESMAPYAAARRDQLAVCTDRLRAAPSAVLMGDFNFDDAEPTAPSLAPWTDLWPVAHPHAPGWTIDSQHNGYRLRRGETQRRIDRIALHDPHHHWRLTHMERVGTAPIAPGVYLSDHFGLVADLRRVSRAGGPAS